MKPITKEDVFHYQEGDLEDPEETKRVEDAIATDPEAKKWQEELEEALAPSPEAVAPIRERFRKLSQATWVKLEPATRATKDLIKRLHDPTAQENVRLNCAVALGQVGDSQACAGLIAVLTDAEAPVYVRQKCAEALGQIGDAHARDGLIETLQHVEAPENVRKSCAAALSQVQNPTKQLPVLQEKTDLYVATLEEGSAPSQLAIQCSRDGLTLRFEVPICGKQPTSLALFQPLQRPAKPIAFSPPLPVLAAKSLVPSPRMCRLNSSIEGASGKLEPFHGAVRIHFEVPIGTIPLGWSDYRLRWKEDPRQSGFQEKSGRVRIAAVGGTRHGTIEPSGLRADSLLSAFEWNLELTATALDELTSLDAVGFQSLVGDDLEILVLSQADENEFTTKWQKDHQRRLWADPAVSRWLCLEPNA